ncbi:hypothetical protein IFU39_00055 [Paenibacillus sp. CFBP 13594]|uniref:hypothetical protein n=1 Tax=Paenibacillus sp. CFBP 13594 TaxID=2774037 RepID=UPI00177B381F|nr:hypothetical protein [Paenibacillus sp. CFBP 13594]MBD8836210.1 hypothetical protein [Paenibacillus sp. CFBP 13594]
MNKHIDIDIILTDEEIQYINEQAAIYLRDEEQSKPVLDADHSYSKWKADIMGERLQWINKEPTWVECIFVCAITKNLYSWLEDGIEKQSTEYVINVDLIPGEYIGDYFNNPKKTLKYRAITLSQIDPHYSSKYGHLHLWYRSLDGAKRGVKRLISNLIYRPTMRVKWKRAEANIQINSFLVERGEQIDENTQS